jgi:hypothetical protein
MEHVEKLREKANVSYAEAKAALDACGDDLLEALLYQERQGKVNRPNTVASTPPRAGRRKSRAIQRKPIGRASLRGSPSQS